MRGPELIDVDLNGLVEDGVNQFVSGPGAGRLGGGAPAGALAGPAGASGATLGLLASHSPLVAAVTGTLAALTAEWVELVRPVTIARRST